VVGKEKPCGESCRTSAHREVQIPSNSITQVHISQRGSFHATAKAPPGKRGQSRLQPDQSWTSVARETPSGSWVILSRDAEEKSGQST
jgi:hypothetical protein